MKLYTKEMFLIAAEKCEVSMIDAQHIMKYIDEYVTPIELPTDQDIDNYVDNLKGWVLIEKNFFRSGAKFMRNIIKNNDAKEMRQL